MTSSKDANPPVRRWRRWFQFSLGRMLLLVTLCALLLGTAGMRIMRASKQKEAVAAIEGLGGQVTYAAKDSLVGKWFRRLLGDEQFDWGTVETVSLENLGVGDADVAHLAVFKDLVSLFASGSKITDSGAQHLRNLHRIQRLDLAGAQITSTEILAGMDKLYWVNLDNTQVDDLAGLDDKRYMHVLKLASTQVDDDDLVHLEKLPGLQELDLSYTPISDAGLAHLRSAQLTRLVLMGAEVTDDGLASLSRMQRLQHLDLSYAPISGAGLAHVKAVESLETLLLSDTLCDDEGVPHIGHLVNLTELSLEGTNLTDEGLAHLHSLDRLVKLDLEGTRVRGPGLKQLRSLGWLQELNLYNIPATDEDLEFLLEMPNLQQVVLWNSRASVAMTQKLPSGQPAAAVSPYIIPAVRGQAIPFSGFLPAQPGAAAGGNGGAVDE